MGKFNTATARAVGAGVIKNEPTPSGRTYEGGPGYARDPRSELFLLAVSNVVGEKSFYESGLERDERFAALVRQLAVTDFDWLTRLALWLRTEANMRSASLVLAAEAAKARLDAGHYGGNRQLVASVLQRADEPGEAIAYWHSRFGRRLPQPLKRGVADAIRRLYTERALLKSDSARRAIRFADAIRLTHPDPGAQGWRSDLFSHAIGERLGVEGLRIPVTLTTLLARERLNGLTPAEIRAYAAAGQLPDMLAAAAMTWEAVPALVDGPWTAQLWEAIVPSMGYMALLRNLRNFDEAGVCDEVAATVAARLADPQQVARSRQFPFRFYAAHKNTGSLRWGQALEVALRHSLSSIPVLTGRTLILVDQSPSMFPGLYYQGPAKSEISSADKAALFGTAMALRVQHADLYGYGFHSYPVEFGTGDAVLTTMGKFRMDNGTDTFGALQRHYDGHDRVVIITDEQTIANRDMTDPRSRRRYGLDVLRPLDTLVPAHVPVFTWNLGGYKYAHATGPNWHTLGGLTDIAFELIPLLEAGHDGHWPWEQTAA
jgi:hypothetical protein